MRITISPTRIHPNLEIALMFFPELRAAIADIAAFMDDDEGPDFDAAQQRAVDAYRNELLPTVLGGEWSRGRPRRALVGSDTPWNYAITRFGFAAVVPAVRAVGKTARCSGILTGRRSLPRMVTSDPTSSLRLGRSCGSGSGSG
jgi:hypothetical protein